MFDKDNFDEEYDQTPEAWEGEATLDFELEGWPSGDLDAYSEPDWEEDLYPGKGDYPELDQPSPGIGPWPKLLFITTIVACLCLAGILSMVSFEVSSASVQPVSSSSMTGQSSLRSPETVLNNEADQTSKSSQSAENCQVSDQFPGKIRQWCGEITKYAGKRGLPADLVAAVILQESGGNPSAYSQSGAVGLMQVMPRDGIAVSFTCASGPCFANRPNTSELQDPDFNIAYGTKMLAGLVSRHGSLREALKSYGPMNVGYYYADKVLGIYQRYGR
jgi:Transglycosylase SLT domain